jgi:hypothetical protein
VPPRVLLPAPPKRRYLPEKASHQIALAAAAGLLLAVGVYLVARPADAPAPPAAPPDPPVAVGPAEPGDPTAGYVVPGKSWEEKIPAVTQQLFSEFLAREITTKPTYPFLVAVEGGPRFIETDIIDDYSDRLRKLHALFKKEFITTLELPDVDEVLPVVILKSRESYDEYCLRRHGRRMPPQITGMYEYVGRRIVMYHDPWAPFEVIFHEGAHQLTHHYTCGKRGAVHSYWFQEGMGTYFEGFHRRNGEVVLDPKKNCSRLPTVRKALKDGSFVPVERLIKMATDDFWKWFDGHPDTESRARQAQLYYAESWALVHFMLHGDGGRHRPAFERYFKCELDGLGTIERFEEVLREGTDLDLAGFQERFIDYVLHLK